MGTSSGQRGVLLLVCMVAVDVRLSSTFNLDVTNPEIYSGEENDFFGYRVLQFTSGSDKGIIVTAPLRLNGSGGICKPAHNRTHRCFSPTDISLADTTLPVKHLGLSIAEDAAGSHFTVCSPNIVHECYENSYLNSVCYNVSQNLEISSTIRPGFQDCTKKTVDLVFLFDGSQSMTEAEFNKNKDFIVDIMKSLNGTSIKFAAVQFSTDYRKVFDFRDYEAGTALVKLKREPHMKTLTNTHKALQFVLEEIFESSAAGASRDATKVLVLITDGDPSDRDRRGIIKRYDDTKIIRFVIGVKAAKLDKFTAIASVPTDKYAFKIENYDGLTGILGNFQKKIFQMEGTTVARAGNMTNEMSQSGFSAAIHKDSLILGSVGSNSWRGALQDVHGETQIEDPDMEMDSYMGYSLSVGEKNDAPLYFTGAPRYEHKGRVILFRQDGRKWTAAQRIDGTQIGSYFGAELCSVDINSDGHTDFLLVGAPMFHHPQEKAEGQIYIYSLTDEMELKIQLNVTSLTIGRFGTAISSLADLNGDGLRDVAVGAPLEDDNSGAVYIYLGDRRAGIRSQFSQRIAGLGMKPGMRFFGQAIDGDIDLGEDGLPDIVVGSKGTAVVLRSRPVFNVRARLSFQPKEISTEKIVCPGADENLLMVTLTVCFEMLEATTSRAGSVSSGLNVSYTLDVDPIRHTHRGFFSQTDKKARNLTSQTQLTNRDTCFDHPIYMPMCVKDTLSPIGIKLTFSQESSEAASAVLNVDSKRQAVVEVPFEKKCRKNDTCIAELEVDFNFTTPTLLVAEDKFFNLSVKLANHGDDSYNTSLAVHYPPGLSFSRMTHVWASRPTLHSCHDLEGVYDRTVCGVSLPVYHSRSVAVFQTSFRVMTDFQWNDSISVTITGESDNANATRSSSLTRSIPVQFEIKMAVTVSEDTVTYLNFTPEDAAPKRLVTIYKIDNPGLRPFPVKVSLFFPTRLEHDFEMKNYQVHVLQNKTRCTNVTDVKSEFCSPEKHCRLVECDGFVLDEESAAEFLLSGDVQFRDLKQHAANIAFLKRYTGDAAEIKFRSFIHVDYDERRYVLESHKQAKKDGVKEKKSDEGGLWRDNDPTKKWTEVRVEFLVPPDQLLIIITGAGLGFLLLVIITVIMFKLGCFKRKTLEYYQEQEEEAALQAAAPAEAGPAPANGTVDQSEPGEEEKLIDGGQADSCTPPAEKEAGPE